MYICICNAIRESDFRAAAHAHPDSSAEHIYLALGRMPQCRQCLDDADRVLQEEKTARKLPATVAP